MAYSEPRPPFRFNRRAIVQPSANSETDRPNPFGKDTVPALDLDPMKRCELALRSQEHGVEYFFPRVERIRASLVPSLRVPLIVRAPGAKRAQVTGAMAMNIDIAPTVLDYADASTQDSMQGRSLRPVLEGAAHTDWRQSVYYSYYENSWQLAGKGLDPRADPSFQFFTPHRGVWPATHKLIHYYADGDVWELFDLKADPDELRNLYGGAGTEALMAELERLARPETAFHQALRPICDVVWS